MTQGTVDEYKAAFVPSSMPSTSIPQFIRPSSAGAPRPPVVPTLQMSMSTHAQPWISISAATSIAMDTIQTDDISSSAIAPRPNLSAPCDSVALTSDPAVQAILNMMSMQHSQMSATLLAMGRHNDEQALAAERDNEEMIGRASLQALGRDIQADQDQMAREVAQITNQLKGTEIPTWYRTIQIDQLTTLQYRSVELASRKTELEQRYHLLAASNESVVARPSSW